ncbi:MAG TPA: hypothetical protein VGM30_10425 [Puia sp.]|jgi:hypothetical protein
MWLYNSRTVESLDDLPQPEALFGFIYKITNTKTGSIYIGKKHFYSSRKKALRKNELSADKRKKTYQLVRKESDWLSYWSSSTDLQKDVKEKGEQDFTREIIALSCSPKFLGYLELKYMINFDVLTVRSYNGNIAGKYYTRDMQSNCFKS